jgi:hypothetical protein
MSWAQFTGTNIASCGTITTPGEYLIGPPFDPNNPVSTVTHSGTGDCIRIKAPNVTIWFYNGDPSYLLGDGQGTAIHILRSARNTQLRTFIGGGVSNFAIGVRDDADNASIAGNFDEPMLMSSTKTGVVLNNVKETSVSNLQIGCFESADNSGCGFQSFADPQTLIGPKTGIFVRRGHDNTITETSFPDATGCMNGFGGVLCAVGVDIQVSSSNHNHISADVYAGTTGINLNRRSRFNTISSGHMSSLENGIALRRGSSRNDVQNNVVTNSTNFDLLDLNPDCGSNSWINNSFTSAQPSGCID